MLREMSVVALLWLAAAAPLRAQQADLFTVSELSVRGRMLEAFAARDEQGKAWLAAISAEAMPPEERRFLTLFARGEPAGAVAIPLRAAAAALDVAEIGGAPGPEVVLLEAGQLRILDARGAPLRSLPLAPPLPLPPRTREQGRLELVGAWSGPHARDALLPDVAGFRLLSLAPGAEGSRVLRLPLSAVYGEPQPGPPVRPGFFRAALLWPAVFALDDDGDGVRDLVATTRYALTTYRGAAAGGLSAKPSRSRRFPPFGFEEERRADSNLMLPTFADIDGDGDGDLVVHRTVGTLAGSRAETRVHLNRGGGADPLAAPSGTLHVDGGVGTAELHDLDGDGRAELVQSVLPFGVAQLARILVRRQAELELRVYGFERDQPGVPQLRWSDEVTLPFDFKTARVTALLPRLEGDYNGDGRRDLIYGDGDGNVLLRVGRPSGRFADEAVVFPLGATGGAALSADLDGDALDELIYWDPIVQTGRLRVARNRGRAPGSPPRLESRAR